MNQADTLIVAQQRANRSGKRMAVYYKHGPREYDNENGCQYHYITTDREDFPDEWIVVAFVDPEVSK